jgi:hypothetical protein
MKIMMTKKRMMSNPQPHDKCYFCGNTREWHKNNFSRHRFSLNRAELHDGSRDQKASQTHSEPPITHTRTPFDPALRLALIEAGVITIQQLGDAEEKLRIVAKMVNEKIGDSGGTEHANVDADSSAGEE